MKKYKKILNTIRKGKIRQKINWNLLLLNFLKFYFIFYIERKCLAELVSRKESGRNEKGENNSKKSNINDAIDDTNYGSIFICDNNSSTSSV